jgi:hypothetical protein
VASQVDVNGDGLIELRELLEAYGFALSHPDDDHVRDGDRSPLLGRTMSTRARPQGSGEIDKVAACAVM